MTAMLQVENLAKNFTLHVQGSVHIPVFRGLSFSLDGGEVLVAAGASGSGKSTLLRLLYGNYKAAQGRILVRHGDRIVDLVASGPHTVIEVRRHTLGFVSQFLRVVPRVPTLDVVSEPLRALGVPGAAAAERAREMLTRLAIPERLWPLSPVTFSGGEQQRVNLARGFVAGHPVLLLDEPTASLDADNRRRVIDLIIAARDRGTAIVGTFHDTEVREAVATRTLDVEAFRAAA